MGVPDPQVHGRKIQYVVLGLKGGVDASTYLLHYFFCFSTCYHGHCYWEIDRTGVLMRVDVLVGIISPMFKGYEACE